MCQPSSPDLRWQDCSNYSGPMNLCLQQKLLAESVTNLPFPDSKTSKTSWKVERATDSININIAVSDGFSTHCVSSFPSMFHFSFSKSPRKWGTTSRCCGSPTRQRFDSLGPSANSWPPRSKRCGGNVWRKKRWENTSSELLSQSQFHWLFGEIQMLCDKSTHWYRVFGSFHLER